MMYTKMFIALLSFHQQLSINSARKGLQFYTPYFYNAGTKFLLRITLILFKMKANIGRNVINPTLIICSQSISIQNKLLNQEIIDNLRKLQTGTRNLYDYDFVEIFYLIRLNLGGCCYSSNEKRQRVFAKSICYHSLSLPGFASYLCSKGKSHTELKQIFISLT